VTNILERRAFILHFLGVFRPKIGQKRIKFGHGGLSSSLSAFWENAVQRKNSAG
jgi:hypothetical protein